ncbi:MAG: DUF354 domain-containing protein [Candidatus Nezhaarchaeales archaeon]
MVGSLLNVWIDILTPKQVLFFSRLIKGLEDRGCEVLKTARRYAELNEVMKLKGVDALCVGKYGGPTLKGKLTASLTRALKLVDVVKRWKVDLAVSFSSPEASRVAFGLGKPHYCFNDSPHAEAVAKLSIPLSTKLFTPKAVPVSKWVRFGIKRKAIVQYNAIDPVAWLLNFTPNPQVLTEHSLTRKRMIIVARVEESYAAYLLNRVSRTKSIILPVIQEVAARYEDAQLVVVPRYPEQRRLLKNALNGKVLVTEKAIDTTSLLYYADLFVGAGGTMTWEASLLGVPTVSCHPSKALDVERYLAEKGLLYMAKSLDDAINLTLRIVEELNYYKELHRKLAAEALRSMDDPVEVALKVMERDFKLKA